MQFINAKYIILFWLTLTHTGLFGHITQNSQANDTIVIASEPDYPPYCIVDESGQADGFSVDLFRAAVDAVGLNVKIKIGIWNQIKNDLARGRLDALPLVGRTPEREEFFDFTMPYLSLHGAVFVRDKTKGINSLDDLYGKKIVVMQGDNAEEFVRREKISDKIYTTNTFEEAFVALSQGKYDAVITQRITGLHLLQELGIETIHPLDFTLSEFRQDFCFAVQEGNEQLLNKLNEGLSIIIANDTYDKIKLQWFGPDRPKDINLWRVLLILLYIIVPLAIATAVFFIYYLRRIVKEKTKNLTDEITDHKKTMQTLHKQQEVLTEMERVTKVGGWEYDSFTEQITWTKGVYDIYGVSPDEFDISDIKKAISYYHTEDQKLLEKEFNKAVNHGIPYSLNLRLISADGKEKWVSTSGHPVVENKKVVRVYGHIMDITAQKRSADELKQRVSELTAIHNASHLLQKIKTLDELAYQLIKVLESILNYDNSAILLIDEETEKLHPFAISDLGKGRNFIPIDKAYIESKAPTVGKGITGWVAKTGESLRIDDVTKDERYFGLREDIKSELCVPLKLGGRTIGVINVETTKPGAYNESDQKMLETISASIAIAIENTKLLRNLQQEIDQHKQTEEELRALKNRLEVAVEERTKELNDKVYKLDRSQKAMLYMVEDLNKMTSELKEQSRKLELSNSELEAFTYSVSHDLRAPLRAINGFARFLMEDYEAKLDDDAKRYIQTIMDSATRMDKLISDLLNLSRVTRTRLQATEVDMEATALSMYNEVATHEEKKSFELHVNETPKIISDSGLIKQVWQNLLSNALKYSAKSKNKKIEIGGYKNKDEVVYYVKDHGAGFNAAYEEKLFRVFQRLHTEDEFKGTGVGLAIVQRIIHRLGGRVWAEGKVNHGATFYFSLPTKENNQQA